MAFVFTKIWNKTSFSNISYIVSSLSRYPLHSQKENSQISIIWNIGQLGCALVSVCLSHNVSCCEIVWIKHILSWMINEGCKTTLAFTCRLSSFVRKGIRLDCKELCLQNLQTIFSNMKYSFFVRPSLNLCPVMQIQIWVCEMEKRRGKRGPFIWISPFSCCY